MKAKSFGFFSISLHVATKRQFLIQLLPDEPVYHIQFTRSHFPFVWHLVLLLFYFKHWESVMLTEGAKIALKKRLFTWT